MSKTRNTPKFPQKYAQVQNVPGCIVFFSDFLRKIGFRIKSSAKFTAIPVDIARTYNLI